MDQAGSLIAAKYELSERAAEGGMATVWRAFTRGAAGFKRPVAVKRILRHLAQDSQFLDLFVEEARVGSQLQHPNIVQIEDFGCDQQGDYYMVSEWVEGLDLGRFLRAHEMAGLYPPWPMSAAVMIEILRGLSWAHSRQAPIFHRDITPGNILIGVNGIAKLADFGLARAMDRARMTDPNIIKGKLAYLAPESTFGEKPSVQSDLYSLGVVLWEALSGRKLFKGETDIEVFMGVREAKIPSLEEVRPDLPAELYQAVDNCLSYKPENRYPSAQHMARALANILRMVSIPTDAQFIGTSIEEARARLAVARKGPTAGDTARNPVIALVNRKQK